MVTKLELDGAFNLDLFMFSGLKSSTFIMRIFNDHIDGLPFAGEGLVVRLRWSYIVGQFGSQVKVYSVV